MEPNHWSSDLCLWDPICPFPWSTLQVDPFWKNPSLIVWTFWFPTSLMPFGALCLSLFTGYIFDQVPAQEELKGGRRENQALLLQALGFLASLWDPNHHPHCFYYTIYLKQLDNFKK